MQHWCEQYVGQPYIEGQNDCAALAERVQRDVFGRDITLPQHRAAGVRGWSEQIAAGKDEIAECTDTPEEGDAVLMIGRGRLNHIGIYVRINGVPHVLHAMKDAGQVCLHRLRDLGGLSLSVEGFYKWRTWR